MLALGRKPTQMERKQAQAFLLKQLELHQKQNSEGAKDQIDIPLKKAFTDFCQVLLNLNEFIYIH